MTLSKKRAAAAFELWLRRYNEEPEKYAEEYGEPESYGKGSADYFIDVLLPAVSAK